MNKKDYGNSLERQALRAPEMLKLMLQSMNPQKMLSILPMKEIWDTQQIIITGCGDSWFAGIATKPVFEAVAKMDVEVMRCVEFTRHFGAKRLGYSPNTPLVIGISISGEVSRVTEAMKRANHYGANTLLITNNPNSTAAKEARHILDLELPGDGEYQPGGSSYIASTTALMQIALRYARVRNTVSAMELENILQAFTDYADAWAAMLPEYADQAFELAAKWKDLRAYDFIGDYADYATAMFGAAKIVECFGGYTTFDDSEGWCHINYFLRNPESLGRVVIINEDTPSYNRVKETMVAIKQLTSPCLVISNTVKDDFDPSFSVFKTPISPYFWMSPLMQHLPLDFWAGYMGQMLGIKEFRADMDVFQRPELKTRVRTSVVEII